FPFRNTGLHRRKATPRWLSLRRGLAAAWKCGHSPPAMPRPRAPSPVIEVRDLVKRFDGVTAVDAVSSGVSAGSTVALLGGNGAGKTTTISMLLGLLLPSSGSVRVLGEDMLRHRYRVLPRMNFSSPYVDLPHRLTVRQNLTVYAHL